MNKFILKLENIVKTFGSVVALNGVNFSLKKGEVHALMGENGAGKSTFIKVATGVHKPDSGKIFLDGKEVSFRSAVDSLELGIAAIYQHATSFPDISVTENIFMGQEIVNKLGFYNWKKMRKKAKEIISVLSPDIDVNAPMSSLSVAEQQLVEIAKALSRNARILILDEPTASISKHECEELYQIVDKLKSQGVSMILITHRFEDMYRLASRVTVFRDAKHIGTYEVNKIAKSDLIKAMVGREIEKLYPDKTAKIAEEIFRVENITRKGFFKNISFGVKRGEILALFGLVGAGRTETAEAIFGVTKLNRGKIFLEGKEIKIKSPTTALKYGIGLLPEDRLTEGLALKLPIYQNVTAAATDKFSKIGFLSEKKEIEESIKICDRLSLKAENIFALPMTLSGGNQQKVVFAKLLNSDLKVLILDEPTKGVDVGAKYSIYETINKLAENGYAIILISSDMQEVLGMADRIIVYKAGKISAEFSAKKATQSKIMEAAVYRKEEEKGKETNPL